MLNERIEFRSTTIQLRYRGNPEKLVNDAMATLELQRLAFAWHLSLRYLDSFKLNATPVPLERTALRASREFIHGGSSAGTGFSFGRRRVRTGFDATIEMSDDDKISVFGNGHLLITEKRSNWEFGFRVAGASDRGRPFGELQFSASPIRGALATRR